jgi:autotransporter passenger strand-loop-strand repeat protein
MPTVSSGQTLDISAGESSAGVEVLSGGILRVLSGGTAARKALSAGEQRVAAQPSAAGHQAMTDEPDKRGQIIRHLEDALALADEIEDGHTGYLIERALDEARSRQFRLIARS